MTITAGPEALAARLDTTDTVVAALRAVPREHFLPARIWVQETDDGPYEPIDRATDPQRWIHDVYGADYAIVTQFDDGATRWPERGWRPSCSASQPSVCDGAEHGGVLAHHHVDRRADGIDESLANDEGIVPVLARHTKLDRPVKARATLDQHRHRATSSGLTRSPGRPERSARRVGLAPVAVHNRGGLAVGLSVRSNLGGLLRAPNAPRVPAWQNEGVGAHSFYLGPGKPVLRVTGWDDLVAAAQAGVLAETQWVELKAALPASASAANLELAKDLASLSVDGGVYIIG